MKGDRIKVLFKVLDENIDKLVWEHVCYCPVDVYKEFFRKTKIEKFELADYAVKWAREDFCIDLPMSTVKDIAILRELILDKYKNVYPHIVTHPENKKFDYQGWVRVWMTEHMKKELRFLKK